MPLFHPRTIRKRTEGAVTIPAEHLSTLQQWGTNLAVGIYDSETQNDSEFIQKILIDVLGYSGSSVGGEWTVAKNQPVGAGNVDVALGRFSQSETQILAPFELKGARTKDLDAVMSGRNKTPVQQAWEYAMDAKGAKWVLVSNYREIRMYAVGYGRKDYETFDLATLTQPENYHRFILLLSASNLLSGLTDTLLQESEAVEEEITEQLYDEYKETRLILINEIIDTGLVEALEAVRLAQTILDRILFVAFAEDKGLLNPSTLKEAFETKNPYNPQPVWDNFKGLFDAIDKGNPGLNIPGYNGGLFAFDDAINSLPICDETCRRFAKFGEYDYDSDVSVNILGHVFEQSISDIEEIKRSVDPGSSLDTNQESKQQIDGVFYTPPFITRQIVENTVGAWLEDQKQDLGFSRLKPLTDADYDSIKVSNRGRHKGQVKFNKNVQAHVEFWEAYKERLTSVKVVDPACGSGAFLTEVFDYLLKEGRSVNNLLADLHGGQVSLFRWDTHILANNIFGVDINRESVEITKLSLWLKTANRSEKLTYLDNNIKTGNSLINDAEIVGELAFDWQSEFSEIMEAGGFDVVVGNPPYVDSELMTKHRPREREHIAATYEQTKGNWDLYIAFLELGCNLTAKGGYLSYITPDKWISKDFGIEIRKRVLPGIVSILPVGRAVFKTALVDSILTTIRNDEIANLHILRLADDGVEVAAQVPKEEINGIDGFDQLLSPHYPLIRKLENATRQTMASIATAENACATSDTYTLGEIMADATSVHAYNAEAHYKIANTGTLDKYVFRWGVKPMRYLKNDYDYPIVSKSEFTKDLGATYQRRAASPKLIIKGLTLLEGALDLEGEYVPGKSTLVICSDESEELKLAAGIVNSSVASFYVKQKYASASYNGGVNFTTEMIDSIPVPEDVDKSAIIESVEKVIGAQERKLAATASIHSLIKASGGGPKMSKKLHEWYFLEPQDFVREIERVGLNLTVKAKAEWADLFAQHIAQIGGALSEIAEAEKAIETLLLAGFDLTDAERDLITA